MKTPVGLTVTLSVVVAALPFTLASCQRSPLGPEGDRLEEARERWRSLELTSYRFVYSASCFCGPTAIQPVEVRVVDGEVASITSVATGEPVRPAAPGEDPFEVLTVERLFAFLLESLEGDPAVFEATYHPVLGHPRSVFVDFEAQVADEEFGFEVSDLSVLGEAVRVPPAP